MHRGLLAVVVALAPVVAAADVIGPEIAVGAPSASVQVVRAVASAGDQFAVVWSEGALRVARFTSDGVALDGPGIVVTTAPAGAASIAFDGVDTLLVWTDGGVRGRFFTRDGTFRGDAFTISPTGSIDGVTVAWKGTDYVVTWNGGSAAVTTNGVVMPAPSEDDEIAATSDGRVVALRTPAGRFVVVTEPEIKSTDPHLHSATLTSPQVVVQGSEVLVTWRRADEFFSLWTVEVWAAVLTTSGEVLVRPAAVLRAEGWLAQSATVIPLWDGEAFRLILSDGQTVLTRTLPWTSLTALGRSEGLESIHAVAAAIGLRRSVVAYSRYGLEPSSGQMSWRLYLRILETVPPPPRRRSAGH